MMMALISRGAVALSAFGLVTAGAVALTWQLTQQRIDRNEKAVAVAALTQVLPAHDNDLLDDQIELPADAALGLDGPWQATIARQQQQPTAIALPVVAKDGYSGSIHMVLGIDLEGRVTGLRVVKHRETPGLGDKIELAKSDWILSFNGTRLDSSIRWAPRPDGGDFDAFTGATITPRAVITATARALEWFERTGRAQILGAANEQ
ncbi:MAG: electron transport complex subunit RsxG [Litorivicinus sp.]